MSVRLLPGDGPSHAPRPPDHILEWIHGHAHANSPHAGKLARLYPPPLSKVVVRTRLIERVRVSAGGTPAGFGKATLVSEWVAGGS